MEYELLTGPRQGDCGGGDGIHNHTNAIKCTKTVEMFPKCHQHWKIINNNRDSRSSQLPENLQKQWWIFSQMSVTNAGKSTQNNKSWGEKIFSWNLRRRGHFAESKLEVGSWKPHVGAVRTRFLAYYPRFAPTSAALLLFSASIVGRIVCYCWYCGRRRNSVSAIVKTLKPKPAWTWTALAWEGFKLCVKTGWARNSL